MPFNELLYRRPRISPKTGSLIYAAGSIIVAMAIIHYSRLLTAAIPTIATFGVSIILLGFVFFAFVEKNAKNIAYAFLLFTILCLLVSSIFRFHEITAMPYDIRTTGYFCGIFLTFVFVAMLSYGGVDRVMRTLWILSFLYCTIYCIAAIVLHQTGKFGIAERSNLILYDPFRGERLFANSATIGFAALISLHRILKLKISILNVTTFVISVAAVLLAQSRMAMLALAVTLFLMVIKTKGFLSHSVYIIVFVFLGSSIFIIGNLQWLGAWFMKTDGATLAMRADSLYLSEYIYGYWPSLGVGYPSSPKYYELITGRPFYPEDLGGVGIISNFGLVGLMWIGILLLLMSLGIKRAFKGSSTVPLGFVGVFCIFYGFTWPTFLYGDGSIFLSLLTALCLVRRRDLPRGPLLLSFDGAAHGRA